MGLELIQLILVFDVITYIAIFDVESVTCNSGPCAGLTMNNTWGSLTGFPNVHVCWGNACTYRPPYPMVMTFPAQQYRVDDLRSGIPERGILDNVEPDSLPVEQLPPLISAADDDESSNNSSNATSSNNQPNNNSSSSTSGEGTSIIIPIEDTDDESESGE